MRNKELNKMQEEDRDDDSDDYDDRKVGSLYSFLIVSSIDCLFDRSSASTKPKSDVVVSTRYRDVKEV
jgi:hypothetical protein